MPCQGLGCWNEDAFGFLPTQDVLRFCPNFSVFLLNYNHLQALKKFFQVWFFQKYCFSFC